MKKITILLIVTCMLLSGCGVRISMADEDVDIESSVGLFNHHSSFFDRYSTQKDETSSEGIESIEDIGLDEIEDNWPECIRYNGNGVYADPMSVSFEIDEPRTLSISCMTTSGKLRLKIVDNSNSGETVYFDENDPKGTYMVDIDKKGTYKVLIYAKYHKGSVEITPIKE